MRKVWNIPGGVHPPENKTQSNQQPIGSIPLPGEIIVPLGQHIGSAATPCVAVGERVLKGQCIATAEGLVSAPVHASTSGVVSAIGEHPVPHPSGLAAPCIVIAVDGRDEWQTRTPCEDYTALDNRALLEKIRNAGIAGMGGAGFPTAVKMNPRADQTINTLILNGTECEPYITADDMLMRERADEIVAGALLFAHLLNRPAEILIGIEDNKPEAIAAMRKACAGTAVEVVSFHTKYPSGGEKQLIQILTGREVPSGGIPAQIGVVVQNVGTALAAWRAVRHGEPLISRVTTVVGETLHTQRNIEVLIGTPIDYVLAEHGYRAQAGSRLIIGGPMMGYALAESHVPVVKTTNCILAPAASELPAQAPAQACIRCGMCAQACPASLLPQQLFWFAQAEEVDKLRSHNLFDCIECGACSYVCPSNIPLVQYYRAAKGTIRQLDADKEKSDRARLRFEFRQARLAQEEAEKEAKRQARKAAAEQAKHKLAEQGEPAAGVQPYSSPPPDAASQRAKLERALSSADSRVARAREQLRNGEIESDTARIESLAARLKQAEQVQSDAKAKLAAFDRGDAAQNSAAQIHAKLALDPQEKQQKAIETLRRRIAVAEEKLAEAEQADSPTLPALRQGVSKLRDKLAEAQAELTALAGAEPPAAAQDDPASSAAEAAIEKAKARAASQAGMSDDDKAAAQKTALLARLHKAQARLQQAEAENSEHLAAFRQGVDKLQAKLNELEEQV